MQFLNGDPMVYTSTILHQAFDNQALKAALGQTFASANAAETVLELTRATGNRGIVSLLFCIVVSRHVKIKL